MNSQPPIRFTEIPDSAEAVQWLISEAERSRAFVWTAGRVLIEKGLTRKFYLLPARERKAILKRLTSYLGELANNGGLERREMRQGIGFGSEIGFNYLHREENS
jgi:hypothetical protein